MTLSIWRYCHLVLAVVSALFLVVASATGIVLAVEPVSHKAKGYAVRDLDEVSIAQTVSALKEKYDEVFSVEVEPSGFVKASVLTEDFETMDLYIDAETGEQLGQVTKRPEIYSFATNLHRSLFLKSIGRFFVGFVSFLLFVITFTGIILVIKRQGGITRFFSRVKKEYFEMRYHVIVSRWVFIPLIILSVTGVYLSAEKFDLLPDAPVEYQEAQISDATENYGDASEIPLFLNTPLSEVRKIDFPFSDDADDYYHIALMDREIKVNQQTGETVATAAYPFVKIASQTSLLLHTGEGSVWWSIVLLIASGSLIFFMYSGFVMTIKRRRKAKGIVEEVTDFPMEESEYIILVGSETGSTFDYAQRLFAALIQAGKKAFIAEMNQYDTFPSAKHIIILTATYGDGEPPTNARLFEDLFEDIDQSNLIQYSVVGFGSLEYPDYCSFAVTVDGLLAESKNFQEFLPLYKINDANFIAFEKWTKKFGEALDLDLKIIPPSTKKKRLKQLPFEVIERTEMNSDYTFLLKLKPKKKTKFSSGDLLTITPQGSENPRQYSIAKVKEEIVLSVKKHQFGKGSNYLYSLQVGDTLSAALEPNPDFHLPKKSKSAILIANGTGIAPFLGMVNENKEADINLLWGTRTYASCHIYDTLLGNNHCVFSSEERKKIGIYRCFSREEKEKRYVQELVKEQADVIIKNFENNGTCMICGSLSMQNDVLDEIDKLLKERSDISLDILMQKGQLKMDCY